MAGEPKRLKLPRFLIITALLLFCVALEYHFHFAFPTQTFYSHSFYIPIILAAIWWGLKGGFPVSLFLALLYMSPQLPNPESSELTRSLAFIFIGSLLGIVSDGRRRAEAALRQSERRLWTTLKSIGDAVIATDAKGAITFVNPVAKNLTGWDEAEAVGRPLEDVFDIVNEQTGEKVENPVARVLREGVVVGLANHAVLIAKDGTKRPIADSGTPMRDEKGNIIGSVMVFRETPERKRTAEEPAKSQEHLEELVAEHTKLRKTDGLLHQEITEYKRTANTLPESEIRFRDIVLSSSNWFWEVDAHGVYTSCSDEVEEILGYTAAEIVGRTPFDLMPPEEAERIGRSFQEIVAHKAPIVDLENWNLHKDGRAICLLTNGTPVLDDKGNLVGYRGADKDITEQKRAKRAMQDARDYATNIVATVREPLLALDADLRVISANRSFYQNFQVDPERTEGQLVYELGNCQWDIPKLRELLEDILPKATALSDFEVEHDFESIGHRVMLLNARQIFTETNTAQMILLAIEDITEQKRAKRAMQDARDYATNIVATVREPLLVLDADLRVISANRSFYQNFQVNPERTEGRLVYELGDRQWNIPKLRELLEDILPKATALTDFEVERDFESVGHRVMLLNAGQIFTETNTAQMILLAIEDITEHKQALRQSEQELAIQNQIADIFLTVSDEEMYGEVLRVVLKALNSKYGVFGYIAENGDLVVPSMTRGVWDQCQVADKRLVFPRETWGDSIWPAAIRQKKTLYSNDPSTRMPEGHIPILRNITLPIIDQGEVIGLFQIANKETDYDARDIRLLEMIGHHIAPILHARLQRDRLERARREAELELQKHRDHLAEMVEIRTHELTEANKELESFNYSVSHDLRAPLRAVSGFAGVLTEEYSGKLDDEGNRLLNIIQENCQTMGRLIDGLLGLSRLGRQQIRFSRIDMEELAREVFEELEPTTSGPKPYLTIKELPPTLGDPAMIRQVFANLLSNAIKFTSSKSNPEIEVSCRKEENAVIYCVKDNGVGFDMEYVDKLFGVFQRLHSSAEFGGSGIGLANVKRIISRHGGEVWAEGKVGEGATFYFTLPKSPAYHKTANLDPLVPSVTA